MTFVCTVALTATMIVMSACIFMVLDAVSVQSDQVWPPPVALMDTGRGVAGFTFLWQQQPHSQMPVVTEAYASYAMAPLQMSYCLPELAFHKYLMLVFFSFFFRLQSTVDICITSRYTLGRYMCLLLLLYGPCQRCTE